MHLRRTRGLAFSLLLQRRYDQEEVYSRKKQASMATVTASLGGGYIPPYAAAPSISTSTTTALSGSSLPTATSIVNSQGGVDSSSLLEYVSSSLFDVEELATLDTALH